MAKVEKKLCCLLVVLVPYSLLLLSYCASLSYASGIERNKDDDDDNNGRIGR